MLDVDWGAVRDLEIHLENEIARTLVSRPDALMGEFARTFGGVVETGNERVDRAIERFRELRAKEKKHAGDYRDMAVCMMIAVVEGRAERTGDCVPRDAG